MNNMLNMPSPSLVRKGKMACPHCGDPATRVKRSLGDRIASWFNPVKRYRCDFCGWAGTVLVDKNEKN